MSKSSFVSKLNEEQLKELTYLCLNECDNKENTHYLDGKELSDVVINDLKEKDDYIRYSSISYDHSYFYKPLDFKEILNSDFCLNDFEMFMSDGRWTNDFSHVLHIYLASVFKEEYLQALMNKRINDAINEKINVENSVKDYLMVLKTPKNMKKKEKAKN